MRQREAHIGIKGRRDYSRRKRNGRCNRSLADLGYKVAILSSSGRGESLAKELGGVGVTGSNQNPEDLKRLIDAAADSFGGIDAVVVNNAGHGPKRKILEITDDDWHLAMEVYLLNVLQVTNAFGNPRSAIPRWRIDRQHFNICSIRA